MVSVVKLMLKLEKKEEYNKKMLQKNKSIIYKKFKQTKNQNDTKQKNSQDNKINNKNYKTNTKNYKINNQKFDFKNNENSKISYYLKKYYENPYISFKQVRWNIARPFLSIKNNRFLLVSSKFYNSLFVNRYLYDINRMNQPLRYSLDVNTLTYNVFNYNSDFPRFDYYLFLKRKKKKISQGLPQLIRYFRFNKKSLYNYKINFNNNLFYNNFNNINIIKIIKFNNIFCRYSGNSKNIIQKDLLHYFWVWKILTLKLKSLNNNFLELNNNNYLNSYKSFFDASNYFLIKNFFKIYKNYYLNFFQFKKILKFKISKKLKNKLFARNLFWKYYKDKFFEKYKNTTKIQNQQVKQIYTNKNVGIINIFISINNTFVTLTKLDGEVLYNAWGGVLGIKGPKRSTPTASEAIAKKVGLVAKEKEIKYIFLKLNGVLYTRKMKSAIKGFLTINDLKILRVINLTPKAHNGIRKRKIKKV